SLTPRSAAVGTPAIAGDWKILVRRIDNPATHIRGLFSNATAQATSGHHFVGVDTTITNNTRTPQTDLLGQSFSVRDAAGHAYFATHFDGDFRSSLGMTPAGGLDPGASMSGSVAFEVPDSAQHLTLYFTPLLDAPVRWPVPTR